MENNKPKNGQIGIGEINTIRDILMGDQVKRFENQMMEMRQEIEQVRNDMGAGLLELKSILKQNNKNVRNDMLNKVVDLENRMIKHNDKTNNKIKKEKKDQAQKLSKLFIGLGKALSE